MRRLLFSMILVTLLIGVFIPFLPVSARELEVGDKVTINGMEATIVGFQGELPVYQSVIYPNIETSSSDGMHHIDNANYNTARTSATATAITGASGLGVGNSFEYGYNYEITRAYLYFNTVSISGYTVTAGSINLYISHKLDTNNESIHCIAMVMLFARQFWVKPT